MGTLIVSQMASLDGFIIIEAPDREQAVRIASLHPAPKLGERLGCGIAVRAIERFVQVA